jgi:hypothetical protein
MRLTSSKHEKAGVRRPFGLHTGMLCFLGGVIVHSALATDASQHSGQQGPAWQHDHRFDHGRSLHMQVNQLWPCAQTLHKAW